MAGQEATALASRALGSLGLSTARYFGSHYINPDLATVVPGGSLKHHVPAAPRLLGHRHLGAQRGPEREGQLCSQLRCSSGAERPPFNPGAATCLLSSPGQVAPPLWASISPFPQLSSSPVPRNTAWTPTHTQAPEPSLMFRSLTGHLWTCRRGPRICILNKPHNEILP